MITIKRISVSSAFRIAALVSGILSLLVLGLFALFQAAVWSSIASELTIDGQRLPPEASFFGLVGFAGLCAFMVCGVVVYAIVGGIGAALAAWIYNFVARQFGGLEIDIEGLPTGDAAKRKQGSFFDADFES
jgi:hypothetical protein